MLAHCMMLSWTSLHEIRPHTLFISYALYSEYYKNKHFIDFKKEGGICTF